MTSPRLALPWPRRVSLVAAFAFALTLLARADTLKMPNGEVLLGTIVQEASDHVVFRSTSFGELRVPRAPGLALTRTGSAAPTSAVAAASAPTYPAPAAGGPPAPPPSALRKLLGLSERWSAELEANLLVQNDKFNLVARGTELTVGYRIPNEAKPAQPRHEYGFFGAHQYQKVDTLVVGENTELAFRYFYQPLSRWLLVSQADWRVDRINGLKARSRALAIPSYRLIDTPSTRLLAGVGPSYLHDVRLIPSGHPTPIEETARGFRIGFYQLFRLTFTPALQFRQTLILLSDPSDPAETYNLRFEASLRRQLSPNLSLNLAYDYVRDENPGVDLETIGTFKLLLGIRL